MSLIDPLAVDAATEPQIAKTEWMWGIERGGILYYVDSPYNKISFRSDITVMYFNGDFILLPTHKTYMDAMVFSKRAGCFCRDEEDDSPRRPLTALGTSFRYVFISLTDAARNLLRESIMPSQTDEDWNGGINPATGKVMPSSVKDYPVVEVHSNPVSVCAYAQEVLDAVKGPKPLDIVHWTNCLFHFQMRWSMHSYLQAPEWFVETDDRNDHYDESLSGSEATGYCPLPKDGGQSRGRVPRYASSSGTADSQTSSRVMEWAKGIPRPRTVRSSSPGRFSRSAAKGTIPGCFQSSPCRKVKRAKSSRSGGKVPSWTQQNGRFPTHVFTSNDWAMFFYGTRLSEDDDGYTD
ncbi:uncharacterized protein SCHCODRAFT_02666000 [Schizophyllum commune H4-8]|nr:uncharacterized protein SCHCODRAFT_02666000 [Schizophyllum commune H4-8]KAI5895702.1 hypothetical protein SCHCODRAFT_02666000 [Schizophyllum commune H4-8]